jgi:hypothetical protein
MLEELGVEKIFDAGIDELNYSCPFDGHDHGDTRPSAYMNTGALNKNMNTLFKCHGCGRGGNAISFVAEFQNVTRGRASHWLRERYAPGWRAPKGGSMLREWELRQEERQKREAAMDVELPTLDWDMYHDRFGADWSVAYDDDVVAELRWMQYILGRGFTPAELEDWAIGYDSYSARVTIPVCDPDGNLLGIKGRSITKRTKNKYMILGDSERTKRIRGDVYGFAPYEKSLVVFGLDRVQERYGLTCERLVFVEGEIDVMSLWKMGIPAVCTGSAHLSDDQAMLLRDYCQELVIFLDTYNPAGVAGVWGYDDKHGEHHPGAVEKLSPYLRVRVVGPHIWDANDYLLRGYRRRVENLIRNARPAVQLQAPAALL